MAAGGIPCNRTEAAASTPTPSRLSAFTAWVQARSRWAVVIESAVASAVGLRRVQESQRGAARTRPAACCRRGSFR